MVTLERDPVTLFTNYNGQLRDETAYDVRAKHSGLWNEIAAKYFDTGDGRVFESPQGVATCLSPLLLIFGLTETVRQIDVRWPDGTISRHDAEKTWASGKCVLKKERKKERKYLK